MPTQEEKAAFARRLKMALNRFVALNCGAKAVKGATDLARQFNLRHSGTTETGITPQTAHKWLTGRVIPTNDKIKTLAEWLGVTEHWLHYGPPPKTQSLEIKAPLSVEVANLIERIRALSPPQRALVEELITQFLEMPS